MSCDQIKPFFLYFAFLFHSPHKPLTHFHNITILCNSTILCCRSTCRVHGSTWNNIGWRLAVWSALQLNDQSPMQDHRKAVRTRHLLNSAHLEKWHPLCTLLMRPPFMIFLKASQIRAAQGLKLPKRLASFGYVSVQIHKFEVHRFSVSGLKLAKVHNNVLIVIIPQHGKFYQYELPFRQNEGTGFEVTFIPLDSLTFFMITHMTRHSACEGWG